MRLRISLFLAFLLGLPAAAPAQPAPDELGGPPFRHLGPVGNRTLAAAGRPGDRNVSYAARAPGGPRQTDAARLRRAVPAEAGVPSRTGHRGVLALHCRGDSRVPLFPEDDSHA